MNLVGKWDVPNLGVCLLRMPSSASLLVLTEQLDHTDRLWRKSHQASVAHSPQKAIASSYRQLQGAV